MGRIRNPKQIENQRSKIKMTTQNVKIFDLCSAILHFPFRILKGFGI